MSKQNLISSKIYNLAERLWPLNRSITGDGVRETLSIIKNELPDLNLYEVPSGTKVFDWTVPKEWRVKDAYIVTPRGKKICEFAKNNLHLVGYSMPINKKISLMDLQRNLHSLPDQTNAIPYVTSYYDNNWGFCLTHNERENLEEGEYEVFIDSELFDGSLTYGEVFIKGRLSKEVFLSTYICHPSMANNELSGPCVTTFIAKKLKNTKNLKYSYRIIFIPETIGSITYLSKNIDQLQKNVIAGFNVSCVGDNRDYSYLPSRNGNTLSDKLAKHVLKHICPTYKVYTWSDRGSDERQYCSPGVDLPIASIMRTKYGEYDEYHTSLDDLLNVVTPEGLEGGYNALWSTLEALEKNSFPKVSVLCEPQLSKRGLYPTLSKKSSTSNTQLMMDLITWSDGTRSMIEIAELCQCAVWDLYPIVNKLIENQILLLLDDPIEK